MATVHLCVHDPALTPYKSGAQALYHRFWIRPIECLALRNAQRVVAVSRYTAERTAAEFPGIDVRIIHNGTGLPDEDATVMGRRRPHRPFRLLYVGNWSLRKGVDLLAPIMRTLGSEFQLQYTADSHGAHVKASLPPNCSCIGRLNAEDLQQAYRDADALLFPSRLEGLPLTVMEAMANGLPVIAAEASSVPEIITNGVDGLFFATDDAEGAVTAIKRLASDPVMWRALHLAARTTALSHFSLDRMLDEYLALYHSLS